MAQLLTKTNRSKPVLFRKEVCNSMYCNLSASMHATPFYVTLNGATSKTPFTLVCSFLVFRFMIEIGHLNLQDVTGKASLQCFIITFN